MRSINRALPCSTVYDDDFPGDPAVHRPPAEPPMPAAPAAETRLVLIWRPGYPLTVHARGRGASDPT